jgi:hypothetical protein
MEKQTVMSFVGTCQSRRFKANVATKVDEKVIKALLAAMDIVEACPGAIVKIPVQCSFF